MLANTPPINRLVSGLTPRNTSKFLIHQTYNTDDSERTADNGYKFKMPEVWSSARSSNKSIAIRKIEWVPKVEYLDFELVIEKESDKSRNIVRILLIIPERTSTTDILTEIKKEFDRCKIYKSDTSNLSLYISYHDSFNVEFSVYPNDNENEKYKIKICEPGYENKPSASFNRVFNQPKDKFLDFDYDLCYGNVWNRCSPLHFHASFIPFDNYQCLGELGDTWQNPIVYQDPNGSPLFNVWATTDMKQRIPILYETFVFRISFIIDVEKHYE